MVHSKEKTSAYSVQLSVSWQISEVKVMSKKKDKLGRPTIKVFSEEQIKTMEAIDKLAIKWMEHTAGLNASASSSSP